ncbi:MAG: hypothetical protein V1809_05900 [Planctomycetota bacterium]
MDAHGVETGDAADRVKVVLQSVVGHSLTNDALIHEISEELYVLQDRVRRIRALSDEFRGVQLSPHAAHLLRLVGKGVIVEPCELARVG